MYSVRYNDLLAPMVKTIQEQQQVIEEAEKQQSELENEVTELHSRIAILENQFNQLLKTVSH
jgi:uncharacterized protein YceH (UPF0502 family)